MAEDLHIRFKPLTGKVKNDYYLVTMAPMGEIQYTVSGNTVHVLEGGWSNQILL